MTLNFNDYDKNARSNQAGTNRKTKKLCLLIKITGVISLSRICQNENFDYYTKPLKYMLKINLDISIQQTIQ